MSFTYISDRPDDLSDVVAYIDRDGDLRIKSENSRHTPIIWADTYDGVPASSEWWGWHPASAKKVFHTGDSVTITF